MKSLRFIFSTLLLAMTFSASATDFHWTGDTLITAKHLSLYDIDNTAKSVCFEIVGQVTNSQLKKGGISLVWNDRAENRASASLSMAKANYNDPLIDSRSTILNIDGTDLLLKLPERKATPFVLRVTFEGDSATVSYIDDQENISTLKIGIIKPVTKVGFTSETEFRLRRISLINEPQPPHPEKSAWTRAELDEYFAKSTDPVEGYWQLLDYNLDDTLARLAGRYTVAIIRHLASTDYDIIYINGAITNDSLWQTCDIKGRLTPTQFVRHFNLQWFTADAAMLSTDVSATIDDTSTILTLNFPRLRSQIRLSRLPR